MSKLLNLNAESQANIIDDDANPVLTITNSGSTGAGLATNKLAVTSAASIVGAELVGQVRIVSAATATRAALVTRTTYGTSTVALMSFGVSGASVPVIGLLGHAFTSCVSLIFAASANWAGLGAIRVKLPDGDTYGWIPVLPDGQVTAATYS